MSGTLYYEVKNKENTDEAGNFLLSHPVNIELQKVFCNIHIYHSLDLEIVKKDQPDLIEWMTEHQGKSDIDVSAYASTQAEDAGYEAEDIMEMQICVFEALNQCVEMEYHAYSSGFDLSQDSFSIEQIKRITNNGSLLSYTDEFRVLYSQLIEVKKEAPLTITQEPQQSSKQLLKSVKENNEDFEWYPTTHEIIEAMYWDIKEWDKFSSTHNTYWETSCISILDIGAGNGKVFKTLKEISDANPSTEGGENRNYTELRITKAYAIEKSQTLVNSLDDDIYVIGTDFHEQTLIDKEVDVVFCNPPYTEFAQWSTRIIKEANAKSVYLVIPERWENDLDIARAIEQRGAKVTIIGNYDFLESEDRKARAKVHLLKIELIAKRSDYRGFKHQNSDKDPFSIWFDEVFEIDAQKETHSDSFDNEKKSQRIKNLVAGQSLIPRLEGLYNEEMQHLMENYKMVGQLDASLLKELDISLVRLKEGLKLKIKGLKNLYWKELFGNLAMITDKLTSKSRESLLGTLTQHTSVDFTATNAYSVIIWAIKNANKYYDSQLLSLYFSFSNSKNIQNYKSNKKLVEDGWRYEAYNSKKATHYSLDYRIVVGGYWSKVLDYDYSGNLRGLENTAQTSLRDMFTIARNLGFDVIDGDVHNREWEAGKNQFFHINVAPPSSEESVKEVFVEIKAFKNGNMHYRFSPKFMKALNLEAARLNGWIKSPKEATEEFDITMEEACEMFGSNFTLAPSQTNLLPNTFREVKINDDFIDETDTLITSAEVVEVKEKEVAIKPANKAEYTKENLEVFADGRLF